MAKNDGCTEFETASVTFHFPKGMICCKLCPLLQTYSRNMCMATAELLPDINGTGMWCPLEIEKEE